MIIYNFQSMDFVAFLCANIVEYRLAILFNSFIVEYLVSILRHQHDVVGNLTIAMAKTAQFQCLSHPSHRSVSYTHLRAHETRHDLVCRLLLEKKKKKQK